MNVLDGRTLKEIERSTSQIGEAVHRADTSQIWALSKSSQKKDMVVGATFVD